jgi:hypothetical protein
MAYNLEKYREKREKVLGVKKRGMNFGMIATIVSICIVAGLVLVVAPKAVSFVITRNLDDAIYKFEGSGTWPKEILSDIHEVQGVKTAIMDKNGTRLVVTFDRTSTGTERIEVFFKDKGVKSTLLNRVSHQQRVETMKEEEEIEAL